MDLLSDPLQPPQQAVGTSPVRMALPVLGYQGTGRHLVELYCGLSPTLAARWMETQAHGCFPYFQVTQPLSEPLPLPCPKHGQCYSQCHLSPDSQQDTARLEGHGPQWIRPWLLFHPHLLASLEKSFLGKFHATAGFEDRQTCWEELSLIGPVIPGPSPLGHGQEGGTIRAGLAVRRKQFLLR